MPSLRSHSTMRVGGEIECLVSLKEFLEKGPSSFPRPFRILGNGSNILIDDRGLKGTAILVKDTEASDPTILSDDPSKVVVSVSAGLSSLKFSKWTSSRGLTGAEYLVGVPGTLGGNLVQNAGANEQELKNLFLESKVFNFETSEYEVWDLQKSNLQYRHSDLKNKNRVVVSMTLSLLKSSPEKCQELIVKNQNYRRQKTPYFMPSLGSIFTRLPLSDGQWLYPGKLIEDAGLKGMKIGDALVSPVHANYIVNEGDAKFLDILELMNVIEKKVFDHSGHRLIREIDVWSDVLCSHSHPERQ